MTETLKIKVDFDSSSSKSLLRFIAETKEGKYTAQKPDLTNVRFTRLEIQEQDKTHSVDDNFDEVILFGVSY